MSITQVHEAIKKFMKEDLKKEGEVTKAAEVDGGWEAVVLVIEPSSFVQSLGIPTSKPVMEKNSYEVKLAEKDGKLEVTSFEKFEEHAKRKEKEEGE